MSKQHTKQLLHIATARFRDKGPLLIQSSDLYGDHVAAAFLAAQISFLPKNKPVIILEIDKPVDVIKGFQQTNWEYGIRVPCYL